MLLLLSNSAIHSFLSWILALTFILTYLYPDLVVTKRRQPPLSRGVVTGQKVKNKNLIHTHIYTSQPLRHTYSLSPTFILTYISLEKTSFHSLTHLFHSYNLPTHSHLAGSLQPCTFRHANFLSCFLGRKTTGRQGFPALCSPSL